VVDVGWFAHTRTQALATSVSDGSLLIATPSGGTSFGFSWHAHKALYGLAAVLSQRWDSAVMRSLWRGLQLTLLYWPLEGLARWAWAGGAAAEGRLLWLSLADVSSNHSPASLPPCLLPGGRRYGCGWRSWERQNVET
jgi:hypothetical protein